MISIIVVNWNVCNLLRSCLTSIRQQSGLDETEIEVYVVDNDSSDGSVAMVRKRFPEYNLIENEENLGFGRANNQAFLRCKGKYVLLLNPDAEAMPDAIANMMNIMEEIPDAGILGARLVNPDGSFQRSSGGALPTLYNVAWHYLLMNQILPVSWAPSPTFLIEDTTGTFDIGWVSGAALMLRRDALGEKIFEEQFFMYGEDLELCDRMQSIGWRVLYTSEATVMHHLRQSLSKHTSEDILASAVKGNRAYFQIRNGRMKTWFYDLILAVGYLIRWFFFKLLSAVIKNDELNAKVTVNRRYALVSLSSLLRGGH